MTGIQKVACLFLSGLFAIPLIFESCKKKEDQAPTAVITVIDSLTRNPVAGITVRLQLDTFYSPTRQPAIKPNPDTKITDLKGEVSFTIEYEASYNADVTDILTPYDTARILVRFQKNMINRYTVQY